MEETTASLLDKTDWRKTLHKKLEDCVDAEGTEYYFHAVKSLISAASATYPGWDAKASIKKQIKKTEIYYNTYWDKWLEYNPTARRTRKYKKYKKLYYLAYKEIFEFIKDMYGRKRMLLWGSLDSQAIGYDELRKYFKRENLGDTGP